MPGPPPPPPPVATFFGPPRSQPARIPLTEAFRYVHEPLVTDEEPIPFLAERTAIERLKDRIRHSTGGSFLVTGFRGVGKTTVVLRTLEEVEAIEPDTLDYLPVVLNVARPITVDQLLFEVVRRLFEALIDKQILEDLSPDVRRALVLAYARTSLSFKETRAQSTELSQSLGLGGSVGGPNPAATVLNLLAPKIGLSRKRTDSMATEASFLAYSHGDVEHDFLRILDLLNRPQPPPVSRWRRVLWRLRGGGRTPWHGQVVVVLDELDKLTSTPEGKEALASLLAGLKNVLTTRHVHFVFVGGPDLHDASIVDAARGNSIYESVFACQLYIPCVWDATDRLLEAVVQPGAMNDEQRRLLRAHLTYKARGIPRLMLRELNELVRWDGEAPYLEIDDATADRLSFYARLQEVLDEFLGDPRNDDLFSLAIDEDRWRLGAYYIADWILRKRRSEFTLSEIMLLKEGSAGEWLARASEAKVQELLDHLERRDIVRVAWDPASGTIIGDTKQERIYELVTGVRRELSSLAHNSERERGELLAEAGLPRAEETAAPAPPSPWVDTDSLGAVRNDRYELIDVIGRGGMGTVYRARDTRLGRAVAVKMLEAPFLLRDENMKRRFRREAGVATTLEHPHIVATYETFEEPDGRLGIVMQLVEGTSLRDALPLPPAAAIEVAAALLEALQYLADRGLARLDLKPENVILQDGVRPVIVDLGLLKPRTESSRSITEAGTTVGTPAYMSPEQAQGLPVDIRSDIHAVGLVLFELLAGERAYAGDAPMAVLLSVVKDDVDVGRLAVSEELRAVIARAVARDRDERYRTPAEMRAALLQTPEAAAPGPAASVHPG